MTQVFAAMNFRLSEEYTKIELPSVEAKERRVTKSQFHPHASLILTSSRLIADARYLQEKLTGLKNVTAPTAMLETIVSEKPIAIKQPPPQQAPQPQPTPHAGRFRGMLARAGTLNGRHSTMPTPAAVPAPNVEKALPPPFSTPSPAHSPSPGPGPEPRTDTPQFDPMADNAPAPTPTPAPAPVPITEKPLVAEPIDTNGTTDVSADADADAPPPQTPPKAEGPSVKAAFAPQSNRNGLLTEELNLPPPPSETE